MTSLDQSMQNLISTSLSCLLVTLLAGWASAQCEPGWLPSDGIRGVEGDVEDMILWDPDGPGPVPERVVLVGEFAMAGDTLAANIVTYDLVTRDWRGLGAGTNGVIEAVVTMPNGDLVVGGTFSEAGGVPASRVARWDGQSWSPLGVGIGPGASTFHPTVEDMVVLPNGDLVVGGGFTSAGGQPADFLARWDGTSWSPINGLDDSVQALAVLPNGNLVAGGAFTQANGAVVNHVAEWDGSNWQDLGGGLLGGWSASVRALLVGANGDLFVGGGFAVAGTVVSNNLARWDGSSWHAIGQTTRITALTFAANGNLVATGGNFLIPNTYIPQIAEWTGSGWVQLAPSTFVGGGTSCVLGLQTGEVLLGGSFDYVSTESVRSVALFRAGAVLALADGLDGPIWNIGQLSNGGLYVAGDFEAIGNIDAPTGVAFRGGGQWSPVPVANYYEVEAIGELPSGEAVFVGDFSLGPVYARLGGAFQPLGGQYGVNGSAQSVTLLGGQLVVGGALSLGLFPSVQCSIATWDGAAWSALGTFQYGSNNFYVEIEALEVAANGDLVAAGLFDSVNGALSNNIARYDGSSWQPMGDGFNGRVNAVACLPNGDIVAGGEFTWSGSNYVQNVARWDGSAWQAMGAAGLSHRVLSLAVLPDGNVVAGGPFVSAGLLSTQGLARWDGGAWLPFAGGTSGTVRAMQWTGEELLVGGEFLTAGGAGSSRLATLAPSCPVSLTSSGAGCGVLAGTSLVAEGAPWIGSIFRATASGMSAATVAVAAWGSATANLPLATVLPQALPACQLLVAPTVLDLQLPVAGSVTTSLALPPSPALAGQQLHEQVIAVEFDAMGNIQTVAASNALSLTIGAF